MLFASLREAADHRGIHPHLRGLQPFEGGQRPGLGQDLHRGAHPEVLAL